MAEALDVGTLSGRIEIVDAATHVLESVVGAIEKFQESWTHAGQHIVENAIGYFTAEAALHAIEEAGHLAVETLKEITIEGARIADVEENFNHLIGGSDKAKATLGA